MILRFKSFSYPEFQTVQRTTKDQKSPEIERAKFFLHRKKNSFELFLSAGKSHDRHDIVGVNTQHKDAMLYNVM